jgi:hypothetical protein
MESVLTFLAQALMHRPPKTLAGKSSRPITSLFCKYLEMEYGNSEKCPSPEILRNPAAVNLLAWVDSPPPSRVHWVPNYPSFSVWIVRCDAPAWCSRHAQVVGPTAVRHCSAEDGCQLCQLLRTLCGFCVSLILSSFFSLFIGSHCFRPSSAAPHCK